MIRSRSISFAVIAVILFFSLNLSAEAQQTSSADTDTNSVSHIVASDLSTSWQDAGGVFYAPLRFTGTQWLATGGIVLGTVALVSVDQSMRDLAQRNQSSAGNTFADIGREYGQTEIGGAIGAAIYLGGLAFKSEDTRVTGRMVLESLLFSGATTLVLKSIIGRSRPYTNKGSHNFMGFQFNTDNTSLPSGHSTVAFAVSSTLAARIHNTWATIGLYSLATLTMGARMYEDAHWLSDTFLGAAIGTAIGNAVANLHPNSDGNTSQSLIITPGLGGVNITYTF
jgi:membrane-associated phospholipid phosphatase